MTKEKHLYKKAILQGILDTFDEFLLKDDEYDIDFNAYEIIDGEKETILDYIDKMIATGEFENTKERFGIIQMEIEDLGGVRGKDLPN